MTMASTVLDIDTENGKKGEWERFKLAEIISDPAYLGKTVRLGDAIFQVKGIDNWRDRKRKNPKKTPIDTGLR